MADTPNSIVHLENIQRVFRAGNQEVHALRGINLQIDTNQMVALKGRSGSGKTTLLNCVGGLDKPTDGDVWINGRHINTLSEKQLTNWRRTEVGFIFQSFGLLPAMSAYENVELMLRLAKAPRAQRRERAMASLEMVGLKQWADHRPYEMSGGQQQRVAIARAIANRPRLILADEPTAELDSETTHEILELFRNVIKNEETTILLVTHDGLVDAYSDRVLQLVNGRLESN